jgi:hypothetical protein
MDIKIELKIEDINKLSENFNGLDLEDYLTKLLTPLCKKYNLSIKDIKTNENEN